MDNINEDTPKTFHPERVFVNDLDSFFGKPLSRVLSDRYPSTGDEESIGEEMGEEAAEMEEEPPPKRVVERNKFEIIGTSIDYRYDPKEDVLMVLKEGDNIDEEMLKCGFIIWDITINDGHIKKAYSILKMIDTYLDRVKQETPKRYGNFEEFRLFILVSSVMTWAATKPVDPDDPEVPFVETDYKKRRPHPNYKEHIALEKEVLQAGKKHKNFVTMVVASGITYGYDEHDLEFLFKNAWHGNSNLPIINPGNNTIPLIHIIDLANIVSTIIQISPKKPQYVLAVEQTPSTQKKIIHSIAKSLGNGRIKYVNKPEAFLYKGLSQQYYDLATVNLRMEPNYVLDVLGISFHTDLNFVENINQVVKEFKESKKLYPIRILLHGPPAVGKTTIAKKLSEYYNIPYISIKTLIADSIEDWQNDLAYYREQLKLNAKKDEVEEEDEEEEEDDAEEDLEAIISDLTEQLRSIQGMLEETGRLTDEQLTEIFQKKLQSNVCQNQGCILDGYPKTDEQARMLFSFPDAEEEGEEPGEEEPDEEEPEGEVKKYIIPQFVISLEASDDFLCNRIMNKSEHDIQGTHYTEELMVQRLDAFHKANTEDNTLLNIFDFHEIHPLIINAETDRQHKIIQLIKEKVGESVKYPPTLNEIEEMLKKQEQERLEHELGEAGKQRTCEEEMLEERQKLMETWIDMRNVLQEEEEQVLIAQNKPLREYMMQFVFPTLAKGLLEVSRLKPDDPIDFLAEYLFNENPEGRMFDPGYVREGDELLNTIQEYQHKVSRFLNAKPRQSSKCEN